MKLVGFQVQQIKRRWILTKHADIYGTPYRKKQHRQKVYRVHRKARYSWKQNKPLKAVESRHNTCFRKSLKNRLLEYCSGLGHYVFSSVLSLKTHEVRLPNAASQCQALIQADYVNLISCVEMYMDSSGFVLHSLLL